MKHVAQWDRELTWQSQGVRVVVGIDEVGRGAWAGPLVACAFGFFTVPTDILVTDSKLLTESQREALYTQLTLLGHWGIGQVTAQEIDDMGLQPAQSLAYERAINSMPQQPDIILIDGRADKLCQIQQEAIVGGDRLVASIAAASIMAKVTRDRLMKQEIHNQYPDYGFNLHVGYGTKAHQQAIQQFGVLPIHRQSYKPLRELV